MSSYGLRTTPPPPPMREVPVDANGNSLRFHHVQFYVDSLKPLEHYKQIERNFAALQAAAKDRSVLLVIDDAWSLGEVQLLNFIDPRTSSRAVVTTRISGLVPGVETEYFFVVYSCAY